jgi:hypothetical protein
MRAGGPLEREVGRQISRDDRFRPCSVEDLRRRFLCRLIGRIKPEAYPRCLDARDGVEMLPRLEHVLVRPFSIALLHDIELRDQENEQQRSAAEVRRELGKPGRRLRHRRRSV